MKKYAEYNNYLQEFPDSNGYYGEYGGAILPDELIPVFKEISEAYEDMSSRPHYYRELSYIREHFQGRPTPVYHCERLSNLCGKYQIYLKREDLNFTGAHKLNHCMGEGLLAKFMGKKKLIAETGAGQHGVALATAAAYFGLECDIYMGANDMVAQHINVLRMQALGAKVIPVARGQKKLIDAVEASLEAYFKEYKTALCCIGSAVGPAPYPKIIRDLQRVVGAEARSQFIEMTGTLPDTVCAVVGGGSNSIGLFSGFISDPVDLVGVEAMGRGSSVGDNAATLTLGKKGVANGFTTYILQDAEGKALPTHTIAAGLTDPGVGPEHAFLKDKGRVSYVCATDEEAIDAFFMLSRNEGIIPALESAHAVAYAIRQAKNGARGSILVNLSGRGDKDIERLKDSKWFSEARKAHV